MMMKRLALLSCACVLAACSTTAPISSVQKQQAKLSGFT